MGRYKLEPITVWFEYSGKEFLGYAVYVSGSGETVLYIITPEGEDIEWWDSTFGPVKDKIPEVAEILGIPPSTCRMYGWSISQRNLKDVERVSTAGGGAEYSVRLGHSVARRKRTRGIIRKIIWT